MLCRALDVLNDVLIQNDDGKYRVGILPDVEIDISSELDLLMSARRIGNR